MTLPGPGGSSFPIRTWIRPGHRCRPGRRRRRMFVSPHCFGKYREAFSTMDPRYSANRLAGSGIRGSGSRGSGRCVRSVTYVLPVLCLERESDCVNYTSGRKRNRGDLTEYATLTALSSRSVSSCNLRIRFLMAPLHREVAGSNPTWPTKKIARLRLRP